MTDRELHVMFLELGIEATRAMRKESCMRILPSERKVVIALRAVAAMTR